MLRRSPRLAAKLPVQAAESALVDESPVGTSTVYAEPIEEEPQVTVVENPVIVAETHVPVVVVADPPVAPSTIAHQQLNNEVVARIHMFNRNMDTLTSKITDLSSALDEMKKKKAAKRKYCCVM